METQFRRQDEQVSALLERTEQMQRQIGEMHQVLFSQGIRNVETPVRTLLLMAYNNLITHQQVQTFL